MRKVFGLLLIVIIAHSCKKGSDDPLFSIYSRKQRLKGSWTLYKGRGSREFNAPSIPLQFNEVFDYSNFTNHVDFSSSTQQVDYSQDMYVYYSFYGKDSVTHRLKRQEYNVNTGSSYDREITWVGKWEWRAGDGKSKSHILIKYTYLKDWNDQGGMPDSSITNFNEDSAEQQLLKLTRLANKELNIEFEVDSSGANYTDISSWKMQFLKD